MNWGTGRNRMAWLSSTVPLEGSTPYELRIPQIHSNPSYTTVGTKPLSQGLLGEHYAYPNLSAGDADLDCWSACSWQGSPLWSYYKIEWGNTLELLSVFVRSTLRLYQSPCFSLLFLLLSDVSIPWYSSPGAIVNVALSERFHVFLLYLLVGNFLQERVVPPSFLQPSM